MKFIDLPLELKVQILKPHIDNYFTLYPNEDTISIDFVIRKFNLDYLYDKEYNITDKPKEEL